VLSLSTAETAPNNLRGRELLAPGTLCPSWAPSWVCSSEIKKAICPKVTPVSNFDLNRYIEHSWFVQKQQVTGDQPTEELFCATATYSMKENGMLDIENRANIGKVNGKVTGDTKNPNGFLRDFGPQCALPGRFGSGKLRVQPCFMFDWGLKKAARSYWVLAIDHEKYEWAIVSGGQPTLVVTLGNTTSGTGIGTSTTNSASSTESKHDSSESTDTSEETWWGSMWNTGTSMWNAAGDAYNYAFGDGTEDEDGSVTGTPESGVKCTTKIEGTHGAGLWLFTRYPNPQPGVVQAMEQTLLDMGVSTDLLREVPQDGCEYGDMPLKLELKLPAPDK